MASERKRLEELLKELDATTAAAFLEFVRNVRSPAMIREVERLLGVNQIDEAINLIDSHVRKFASVIPRNQTRVGISTVEAAESSIRRIQPRIAISFDPAHPRAAAAMQQQSLDVITRIGGEQKTAIRSALTEAFQEGANPRQAARVYRDSIGLTEKQLQHVKNYRSALQGAQNGVSDILNRGLRDKSFDGAVKRAFESGERLSDAEIDRMVAAYEQRYIKYRSEVIARTESAKSVNAANHEATQQVMEAAGFEDDYIERTWQYTHDSRTRDSHRNLQKGVVIGQNTPFITGLGNSALYPLAGTLPKEDLIQCRCTVTVRYRTREEVEAARGNETL